MKTNTIYTALVATIATVLTFTATNVASAQSSSRRNNSGGNTTATQRSSDTRQKAAQVSQPRSVSPQDRKTSTPQNRTTDNKKSSSDRNATQSRGNHNSGVNTGRNYNDHMGNVRTQSGIDTKDRKPNNGNVNNRPDNNRPNNGNVTNRPDNNRPNNGNVNNRPDNKPNNNRPETRPEKDNKPHNGNVTNRPGTEGPRPTYYAGRGGNSATKLPPAPRFDRANPNRHLGYNPFRDGRIIHRPATIHIDFDFGLRYLTRPRHYYKYRINGMSMYFWSGVWYWHAYGYYNVHRPPVGTRIPISDIAPYLYEVDYDFYSGMNTRTYYVDSYANFYVQVNSYELQVVNAPDGAVLYDMPSDYKEIVYDGSVYYVVGNSIFEYVYSNANSWYFRAVGIYR
ncbi:MAG: hypothetical protein IKX26_04905 [Bacteroidales bacterium]|nr:hypothetical protein [Bacteroidales bacterium]